MHLLQDPLLIISPAYNHCNLQKIPLVHDSNTVLFSSLSRAYTPGKALQKPLLYS